MYPHAAQWSFKFRKFVAFLIEMRCMISFDLWKM